MPKITPLLKIGEDIKVFSPNNKVSPRQVRCYTDNKVDINFINLGPKERVSIKINDNSNKSGAIYLKDSLLLEKGIMVSINKDRESIIIINLSDVNFMISDNTDLGDYHEF